MASPQIAVASVIAFTVSEVVDSVAYSQIRVRSQLVAVLSSNIVGLITASALFVPMAFGSFVAVPGQILGKTVTTVLTIATLLLAKTARRAVSR